MRVHVCVCMCVTRHGDDYMNKNTNAEFKQPNLQQYRVTELGVQNIYY